MEKEFLEMINTHRGIIYKVCNLYEKEHEYRQDLFQEIVLQLWQSFSSFQNRSLLSTWMYRVALNTAISQLRKNIRKPVPLPLSQSALQIPDLTIHPDENEQLWILQSAVARLSSVEKAIIMLYLEEKSYAEISEIMGITLSNVGVKLNRVKSKLEKIIKENNYEHR